MSMDDDVQKLAEVSRQLNSYSDRLNEKVRQLEDQLREAGLNGVMWVDAEFTAEMARDGARAVHVGWSKESRQWSFYCRLISPYEGIDDEVVAFLDAPGRIRVAAFPYLNKLVAELLARARNALAEFESLAPELAGGSDDAASDSDDIPF